MVKFNYSKFEQNKYFLLTFFNFEIENFHGGGGDYKGDVR